MENKKPVFITILNKTNNVSYMHQVNEVKICDSTDGQTDEISKWQPKEILWLNKNQQQSDANLLKHSHDPNILKLSRCIQKLLVQPERELSKTIFRFLSDALNLITVIYIDPGKRCDLQILLGCKDGSRIIRLLSFNYKNLQFVLSTSYCQNLLWKS